MNKKDLEEIYYRLLALGAGRLPTEMVMEDDEMFDKYLGPRKQGVLDIEIAFQIQDEWLKRNPSATMTDFTSTPITIEQITGQEKSPEEERREKLIEYRFQREKERNKK